MGREKKFALIGFLTVFRFLFITMRSGSSSFRS